MVARSPVMVLDPPGIAAEDNRNAMARVSVPWRALAGCEMHPSNQCCAATVEDFFGQRSLAFALMR